MTSTDEILAERGKRYGVFKDHAMITQALKLVMAGRLGQAADADNGRFYETFNPAWEGLAPDQREALEMIAHKIGRILNGDPNYIDSWTDVAGYATLVAQRLEADQNAQNKVEKPVRNT